MLNIKKEKMKKEITFSYKKKKIKLKVKECNFLQEGIGLMFSRREKAEDLIFRFRNEQKIAIHSFFVFFPFVALWLNKKNEVVDLKIVEPFTSYVSSSEKSVALVEIPINRNNKKFLRELSLNLSSVIRKV